MKPILLLTGLLFLSAMLVFAAGSADNHTSSIALLRKVWHRGVCKVKSTCSMSQTMRIRKTTVLPINFSALLAEVPHEAT